jgi:hypothetical protein
MALRISALLIDEPRRAHERGWRRRTLGVAMARGEYVGVSAPAEADTQMEARESERVAAKER